MARLLLTATAEVNQRLTPKLAALGHEVVAEPLLKLAYTPPATWPLARDYDAILLTSRYALPAACEHYRTLPVYGVGEILAELAQEAGLSLAGHAASIAALKAILPPQQRLLHLRGKVTSQPLADHAQIQDCIIYQMHPAPLSDATQMVLQKGEITHIIALSQQSLQSLATQQDTLPQTTQILCFSPRVAAALPARWKPQSHTLNHASEASLLAWFEAV